MQGPDRFWRYRADDYRIICDIQHRQLVAGVVKIGHRQDTDVK
nr:type II toxin-antitoxin system RelE/ParE family toxin [uncultured Gellertiella sp.]